MAVVKFRPFKIPPESAAPSFNPVKPEALDEYMRDDLAASGLVPEDMFAYTHTKALPPAARMAYIIPYFSTNGEPLVDDANYLVMWRKKCDIPGSSTKYVQPPGSELAAHKLPRFMPYILPQALELDGTTLYVCEGEKKTASFVKHIGRCAIGIGGCNMWHDPAGDTRVHPWILEVIARMQPERVVIVPDGDLWKYDICKAYGDFARAMNAEGLHVEIVECPDKIDDLIVRWGPESAANFDALPRTTADKLFQSPKSLMLEYNLPFRETKAGPLVEQHTGTVTTLLERHPAFPQIWRNTDTQKVYIGSNAWKPDATEMQIANHMQINFGLSQIKHTQVRACMLEQASKNERSPFLERVRSEIWDGQERLETWMVKHWGVPDTAFAREASVKWLVGSVARLSNPGTKFDWMLVVTGGQGTGKTSMPGILFNGHDVIMYGENHDKDLYLRLHSGLVIVIDELDSFTKRDATFWKSVLTTATDTFRAPYAASVETYPRRSVLYGTSNLSQFLAHDPSGYRRYAILAPERKLDFAWLQDHRWQLWAEALSIYESGQCDYWELDGVSDVAAEHVVENPLAQRIETVLEARQNNEPFQMSDLLSWLDMGGQSRNTAITRDAASILRELGYRQRQLRYGGHPSPRRAWVKPS